MNRLKFSFFKKIITFIFVLFFIPVAIFFALIARLMQKSRESPRIVWGSTPIINNSYWSRAMVEVGYVSETCTFDYYSSINKRSDWDILISEEFPLMPSRVKPYLIFLRSLFLYDVFFISFNGFFIGDTPAKYFQSQILKMAGKKIVVLPYGGDSYVYKNIRSTSTIHGLLMSYPLASKHQQSIAKDVDYWTKNADAMFPAVMGPDGFGRWDALLPSGLFIDLLRWVASKKNNAANGVDQEVVIAHAPNHRGFKGSEFVIKAVNDLKSEGFKIRFLLIENIQNERVREIFQTEVDILVEQLICTGYGMNGLEGLASGLPTIANLEDENYTLPLRRWSYLSECPIVSATPENLVDVIRKLVTRPDLRHKLGNAGRVYAEKYHGLDSAQYFFGNVIDYVYGKKESLINLYHPLLGEYPNRSPKIQHPLINNRIVD